jgi:HAD superfamily phosphatase (TIGR01681 family)
VCELLARIPAQKLNLVVASSFTANPIADSLSFWFEELKVPARIQFAPYGQLFQQLLDPHGLLADNSDGVNLILLRLEDWNARGQQGGNEGWDRLEQNVRDFLEILQSFAEQNSITTIIVLCPPSAVSKQVDTARLIRRLEANITAQASVLNTVSVLQYEEISHLYDVAKVNDPHTDELGHVPYTPQFFTALGTAIARKIFCNFLTSYKVIVLDCDETLWGGVCGEDGPDELRTGFPYQTLQELLVQQQNSGKQLCLSSKNTAADVLDVFRCHPEMPLKPEHFISYRINWDSTSENLNSLSRELDVAPEAFVYLSSNPVECEQVRADFPDLLSLLLPAEPSQISSFLDHLWLFEKRGTAELEPGGVIEGM